MSELIMYLFKVSCIIGLFYLFYFLLLKNKTRHAWNRQYLLFTLVFSVVIPLFELPSSVQIEPLIDNKTPFIGESTFNWVAIPVDQEYYPLESDRTTSKFFDASVLVWVYFFVVIVLLFRSVFHLIILHKLKKQSQCIHKSDYKLFKTVHSKPFSFLNSVFIPDRLFSYQGLDQIIEHECAHVKQLHSLDRLLMDFYVSLFWFNPFIYLYRKALIEVHEYQADEAVIKKFNDPIEYQEALYEQLTSAGYPGLVSHFNFSLTKKRIVMINKNKTKTSIGYHLLALPVIAAVIFAFSSRVTEGHLENLQSEITVMMDPALGHIQLSSDIPSIFPVERDKLIRISSGFGKRTDPILKTNRMHNGVDFSAPEGAEVYATADGKVIEVGYVEETYGNYIVLDHGQYLTRYHHLSIFNVEKREQVKLGEVIGAVGNTGRSTAPHLHYEVIKNGEYVNPTKYLPIPYEMKKRSGSSDSIPSVSPIEIDDTYNIYMSSEYGKRKDPVSKKDRYHRGVDFAAPLGVPVYATADGQVEEVETYPGGYGKRIIINHGAFKTSYAHLSAFEVKEGQNVKKGAIIGKVGNSGKSMGPHLHYEVWKEGKHVNPAHYINDYQFKVKDKEKEKGEIE